MQVDGLGSDMEMDGIDGTRVKERGGEKERRETRREMLPIDLLKSTKIGAADSQLGQRIDPPLGSDLHYDDK